MTTTIMPHMLKFKHIVYMISRGILMLETWNNFLFIT